MVRKLKVKKIKSVWILGSTSTLASEICIQLAKSGCKRFFLLARDNNKNIKLASYLKSVFSVEVTTEEVDLLENQYPSKKLNGNFDLYIICAGLLKTKEQKDEYSEELAILKVNYISLLPWISSIVTPERIERLGSLWVLSSVAADKGRPSNYKYGSAKAGLTIYCEGLSLLCHGKPFSIRIIKAGLIDTKMSSESGPKILSSDPKKLSKKLLKNPFKNGVEYFPFWWKFIMIILKLAPAFLVKRL